ncbi:cell division protein FtsA [Thermosipho melanesiensis]|uniref:Cell division protein FtsA n=2 Tax=Thermosipho melanesiensis TaxID=46541 RepID=A6LPA0_THEM4|nr:cell division FtsA domain-containing protein [Thermosipho melanesiensis]ABR31751.1 cell division protein FtsA [Thermosipho melanesiensis BI429]APT74773.1 cell division protein FtsA [Thermosipho melanesiensis]OOC35091.1 cell division protein FtsA [Thermosipho melanesiensis]OOC35127.1 cell division protein FtsA [Thermosipho melanesiensis]OOC36735.1 cell division protein FtsA [Thermosipho melanesiensis]
MIFALDVGTRKIAGILATFENEKIVVHDIVIKEHEHRAMLDGQIHDVEKVARVVKKVKEELEERNNLTLDKVAVALAGRFLTTAIGNYEEDISHVSEIDEELITRLELSAVDDAVQKIGTENMYCVGYSVISYELDGNWLKKIKGLKGKNAKVEVVTAFLPVQVVDAMVSVLRKVNLTMTHMTLEPIAAINVTVPEDLRILNIALVDVGAGTSDIAISKEGTIIAYGMVPLAGDEITDSITKTLLVDFITAENLKRWLNKNEEKIVFRNILDKEKEVTREELLKIIAPVLENITTKISEEILTLNGEKPQVVMVVGGGAKVPGFVEKLAEKLDVEMDNISLKNAKNLSIVDNTGIIFGSEFVTPLGIAYTALTRSGTIFEQVFVNDEPVQLVGFSGGHTLSEVLLQCGYSMSDLLGKPTESIVLEVNGKMKILKGELPKPAPIYINGKRATLRDKVKHGDRIVIGQPSQRNEKVYALYDIVQPIVLDFGDKKENYLPPVILNGDVVRENSVLKDGDKIEYNPVFVKNIREELEENLGTVEFFYNDIYFEKKVGKVRILKGDLELSDKNQVNPGDVLKVVIDVKPLKIKDITEGETKRVKVILNGREEVIEKDTLLYEVNGVLVSKEYEIKNGDKIYSTYSEDGGGIILADIFSKLNVNLKNIKTYKLLKNGKDAYFTEPLSDGDEIIFTYELRGE